MELLDIIGQSLHDDPDWKVTMHVMEDNAAMLKLLDSGQYSAKLRHASRTHRTNLAWVIERFREDEQIKVRPCKTVDQAADIYTKRFSEPRHWCQLLYLNNIVNPDAFWNSQNAGVYWIRQLGTQYKAKFGTECEAPDIRGHVLEKFRTSQLRAKLLMD